MQRKKSALSAPVVDGKHNMSSMELSEADDLATMMTVDAVLGFATHKMDKNFNHFSIDKRIRDRWKEIMQNFISESNYEKTYQQLILNDRIKSHWKRDERFKRHVYRFLYLFDKRSGIEVKPCFRYENEERRGGAIYSTREWEKGSQIKTLFGCIAEIRATEEEHFRIHKNEFSVMYSTRKNCSQLWLGPAAYVNHDCKPNCRFTEGNDDSNMLLETLRDIHPGDELLIYYGDNFFGTENNECECFTCELRGNGFFKHSVPHNFTSFQSPSSPIINRMSLDSKRIMTRSAKQKVSARDSISQSLRDGLKRNDNAYSLRVTYSRIDRVKQGIRLSLSDKSRLAAGFTKSKVKLKPVVSLKAKPSMKIVKRNRQRRTLANHERSTVSTRCSLRRQQQLAQSDMTRSSDRKIEKLTITLRKNSTNPGQYEPVSPIRHQHQSHIDLTDSPPDCNIFSRMTQLYLAKPPPSVTDESPPDTPPFLSPWFCSSAAGNPTWDGPQRLFRKASIKPPLDGRRRSLSCLKITNLTTRPTIVVSSSSCETSDAEVITRANSSIGGDIRSSYCPSSSSPTIPVLEIEESDDSELPPPQLVCEVVDSSSSSSPNKAVNDDILASGCRKLRRSRTAVNTTNAAAARPIIPSRRRRT